MWSRPQAFPDLRFVTAFRTSSTLISWFREWFVSSDTSCSCTFDSSTVSLAAWPSILLKWSYQTFISILSLTVLLFSPPRLFRSFQNTDAFLRLVARSAALFRLNSFFLYLSFRSSGFLVFRNFRSFSLLSLFAYLHSVSNHAAPLVCICLFMWHFLTIHWLAEIKHSTKSLRAPSTSCSNFALAASSVFCFFHCSAVFWIFVLCLPAKVFFQWVQPAYSLEWRHSDQRLLQRSETH